MIKYHGKDTFVPKRSFCSQLTNNEVWYLVNKAMKRIKVSSSTFSFKLETVYALACQNCIGSVIIYRVRIVNNYFEL